MLKIMGVSKRKILGDKPR